MFEVYVNSQIKGIPKKNLLKLAQTAVQNIEASTDELFAYRADSDNEIYIDFLNREGGTFEFIGKVN